MNRRPNHSASNSNRWALLGTCAATLVLVFSCALLVGKRDASQGEPRALALDITARADHSADAHAAPAADFVATGSDASSRLAEFGARPAGVELQAPAEVGALTQAQQDQLDLLVAQLEATQALKVATEAALVTAQDQLVAAQAALVAAQAMPESNKKEARAKTAAIKKAKAKINIANKTIASCELKIANYDTIIAETIAAILAIDPNYFSEDPTGGVDPPAAPSGVTASVNGTNAITLTWPAVETATAYDVFWSTSTGVSPDTGTLVSNATSPYTHSGLAADTTYYYVVTAVNDAGSSPASDEASAHVPAASGGGTGGGTGGTGGGTGGTGGTGGNAANVNSPLGTNFLELSYFSPEWVFTDAMKQSMPWVSEAADSSTWDTGYPLHLDANGWPILGTNPAGHPEAAGTVMYRDIDGHYPTGDYVCLYDGQGTIEFGFDAHIKSQTPGRIVVNVPSTTDNGIFLKITASNPSNRVRNVRMMLPGFETTTETFHPLFVQRMAPFKVLRFMDWQRTNMSQNKDWANRNTKLTPTQDDNRGVALEYMIELSNKLHADMWICIPHLATNDYVAQFATMVRDQLDPTLKVYVEHSNEVWNGAFGGSNGQYQYCINQGVALGLDPSNQWVAGLRYHSQRSVEIFNIFQTVFGGTSRIVRTLGGQSANPWACTQVMDWKNAYQKADALAVAPYFGYLLDDSPNVVNMSTQQIISYLANDIATVENPFIASNHDNTDARGLRLIAYEAGQHLCGVGANLNNQTVTNKFIAANRDPAMYDLYMQSFNGWAANGGEVMCTFAAWNTYSKWGSWGAMEYQDQNPSAATAPKYAATIDYVAQQQAANSGP